MLNILLVDDEALVVNSIQNAIDWNALNFTGTFVAYNMKQAQAKFHEHTIDLMLCDIEMPHGSGLDLMRWVKEHYPNTKCIFLTAYANFQYAKEAINLSSLDYLLKPLSFEKIAEAVSQAAEKIIENKKASQYALYGRNWEYNKIHAIEKFWEEVLAGYIPSTVENLIKEAGKKSVHLNQDDHFLPILIKIQKVGDKFTKWQHGLFEYSIQNIISEVLLEETVDVPILVQKEQHYIVLLPMTSLDYSDVIQKCKKLYKACSTYLETDICSHIGRICSIEYISDTCQQLNEMAKKNVSSGYDVLLIDEKVFEGSKYESLDMSLWPTMISEGKGEYLLKEIYYFLDMLIVTKQMNIDTLSRFEQDFNQFVSLTLDGHGIRAHRLFEQPQVYERHRQALYSVNDMRAWVEYAIFKVYDLLKLSTEAVSVIDKSIAYMKANLNQNLSREDIAKQVFLNADYLTRLFKKETNMTISEFFLMLKMDRAKELILKTDLSISQIAVKVGFDNFSHFSRVFKKYAGLAPVEFREAVRVKNE